MSQNTQWSEPYIVKFGTVSVDEEGILILADFSIDPGDSTEPEEVILLTAIIEGLEEVLAGYKARHKTKKEGKKWLN